MSDEMTDEQAREHMLNEQIPSMRRIVNGMLDTIRTGMALGKTAGMPKDVVVVHTALAFCQTLENGFELEPDPIRDTIVGILLVELADKLGPMPPPVKSDTDNSAAIDMSEL